MPELAQTAKLKSAIAGAVEAHTGPEVSGADAKVVAAVALAEVKADPVLQNAANLEPWWQSGVGVFGAGGLIWSIGFLIAEVGKYGLDVAAYGKDMNQIVSATGTVWFFAMVLYRRFMPGLKPMFWRWVRR